MAESILQSYLNNHHIKLTDETGVENLKKAVTVVKKRLTKTAKAKKDIINFTLVALDPKILESDPVVIEVEQIIINKWTTFKTSVTATKDKSTTYIRAVILDALAGLAKEDITLASLIWHSARNVISHYNMGTERNIVSPIFQEIANDVETEARNRFSIINEPSPVEIKGGKIELPALTPAKVNQNKLYEGLLRGAQHTGWKRYSDEIGDNPSSFNQNWSKPFADMASKSMSDVIDEALRKNSESIKGLSDTLKNALDNYFLELAPFFAELTEAYNKSATAGNKRGQLLWWKQTLCSPSSNQSYRSYSSIDAALLMAIDLSEMVDPIYPISVDYFLREALKDAQGLEVDNKIRLGKLMGELNTINQLIKEKLNSFCDDKKGCKPLMVCIANQLSSTLDDSLPSETGLDPESELAISDIAVWLFHDLQSQKIANSK